MEVLSSKSSQYTFYNDSFRGVYGLFLCRGDVDSSTCQSCINDATIDLPKTCSSYRGGVIWYEKCLLRYSNTDFFGEITFDPDSYIYMRNLEHNTSPEDDLAVLNLLKEAIERAAQNSSKLYGTQEGVVPSNVSRNIYVLVQCTRDLNRSSCYSCLTEITDQLPSCCLGWAGWRFLTPSCLARFDEYVFYSGAPQPALAAPPTPNRGNGERTTKKVVIVSVSSLAAALAFTLAGFLCFSFCRKGLKGGGASGEILSRNSLGPNQRHVGETVRIENTEDILLFDKGKTSTSKVELREVPLFKFVELATSTNNFNTTNLLGQGGFGPVYRGTLQNGQGIAVKRLSRASGQGADEFKNEVLVISSLQHRNLVKLLGCCVEGEEKILVYEYMPNKSLDTFLFDLLKKELLDWRKRFNIIEGISQDFGLARIFGDSEDQANTKRVVGTYGYMPPEYAMEGLFSEKSDIYSYGVLLLEIVSGRRNNGFDNDEHLSLVGYAWKLWNEGNILPLVDNMVADPSYDEEVLRCIHVGLLCVQEFAKDRPNMSTVISMVNSEIVDLPRPKQPAFILKQNHASDAESSAQHDQQRCSLNHVTLSTSVWLKVATFSTKCSELKVEDDGEISPRTEGVKDEGGDERTMI
ncbi:hypothetical protein SLEP1_g49732 [Rubroshorea leprosula]|uniref:non-specific serine/threonine protein kinase n=1 Tax=Rubroshorea leprosula TaxID=152421 RepID=A0AAV5LXR9_9ROSI|nr:hypothetical protein SLEP1_g49732 [Rubroshorea leprosula]